MMKRNLFIAGFLIGFGLVLAGCAADPETRSYDLIVSEVTLPNGSTVLCVSNANVDTGGITCNW